MKTDTANMITIISLVSTIMTVYFEYHTMCIVENKLISCSSVKTDVNMRIIISGISLLHLHYNNSFSSFRYVVPFAKLNHQVSNQKKRGYEEATCGTNPGKSTITRGARFNVKFSRNGNIRG